MPELKPAKKAISWLISQGIIATQKEFGERIGVTNRSYLSQLVSNPTLEFVNHICALSSRLNRDFILTGEGNMLNDEANAKMVGGVYSVGDKDDGVLMIDYIPVSATASFIENLNGGGNADFEKYPLVPIGNEGAEASMLRVFEVEGDSMYPTIPSGAQILAKEIPEKSWHYAEGVVVAVYDTFVVVKRIVKNDLLLNNTIILGSDNKDYGQMIVQQSDLRALYKAKRIISSAIR